MFVVSTPGDVLLGGGEGTAYGIFEGEPFVATEGATKGREDCDMKVLGIFDRGLGSPGFEGNFSKVFSTTTGRLVFFFNGLRAGLGLLAGLAAFTGSAFFGKDVGVVA
jgi:hypothetical protein